MKESAIQRVNLCPECGACPEVVVEAAKAEVAIGEAGNLVKLNREAWNTLVEKIQTGELKKI
ncbi:MAG: hypothetical protein HYS41_07045 [Candidatus Omnitrophica bacterium]|nr:hypothetical protein [Candidatus Omnitrophota bacterium]